MPDIVGDADDLGPCLMRATPIGTRRPVGSRRRTAAGERLVDHDHAGAAGASRRRSKPRPRVWRCPHHLEESRGSRAGRRCSRAGPRSPRRLSSSQKRVPHCHAGRGGRKLDRPRRRDRWQGGRPVRGCESRAPTRCRRGPKSPRKSAASWSGAGRVEAGVLAVGRGP